MAPRNSANVQTMQIADEEHFYEDDGHNDEGHSSGSSDERAMSSSSGGGGTSPRSGFTGKLKAANSSDTNLIVNYLPQQMTQEEFRVLFATKGPLESCKLVRDKLTSQSLGYGFVNYVRPEDAQKALATLNGLRLHQKTIKVSLARPSSETIKGANLYVSGLPKKWEPKDLEAFFAPYGKIITSRILSDSISGLSKGVGFVRFDQRSQAESAIEQIHGMTPEGHTEPIQVKFANNPTATATAIAAAAAAAAVAVGSPSPGLTRSTLGALGVGNGGILQAGSLFPALAAFMGNGGLGGHTGASGFGLGLGGPLGMSTPVSHSIGTTSNSGHRSRTAMGPIHHQTPRVRYSPMSTGDMMAAGNLLGTNLMSVGLGNASGFGGASTASSPSGGWSIFVYNLAPDTEETTLWQLFGPFGGVQSVKVIRDPTTQKCKGFAFVTMTTYEEAYMAIQSLNGYVLGNRVLQVSFKSSNRK